MTVKKQATATVRGASEAHDVKKKQSVKARARGLTGVQVYEEIKNLIRRREFAESEPVSENLVSRRLNVSRTPVREAFLRLKAEGWLTESEGQGLVVSVVSEDDLQDTYVVRESLEAAAARLATRNATQPELYALREIARQFVEAVKAQKGSQELDGLNARFHALLYKSSHSRLLERILEPLHLATNRYEWSVFEYASRPDESAKEHLALAEALLKRDGDLAEGRAREHVRRGGEVRSLLIAERLVSESR